MELNGFEESAEWTLEDTDSSSDVATGDQWNQYIPVFIVVIRRKVKIILICTELRVDTGLKS